MSGASPSLGEFEHLCLLILARHQGQSYGSEIRSSLKNLVNRDTSIGALYTTLDRLVNKGFLENKMGQPTAVRGGRAKKYYVLTAQGRSALQTTRATLETLWQGVEL